MFWIRVIAIVSLAATACGGGAGAPQAASTTAAAAATTAASATPKGTGQLVFVGNGGSTQDSIDQSFLKPFSDKYGVKITQGTDSSIARVKAAVLTGHPDFDVTSVSQADYLTGLAQDLWAPIDYSFFRPEDLASIPAGARFPKAVGDIYYSQNAIFNTKVFPSTGKQPNSWADFWNLQVFPGKRSLPTCNQSARTMMPEAALIADGVTLDKVYPLDIPRAVAKIKTIASSAVWYDQVDTALTLLSSGDTTMAIGPNGRAQTLIDKGAPLQIVWNQARATFDVWVILKGATNIVEAQKLIAFMSQPDGQAKMANLSGYGPTNPDAYKSIDPKVAAHIPSNPDIAKLTFTKNDQWWLDNTQKWIDACSAALGV
jgi:putative spermidine/putrescine transport system substrate-binding protein